jgi:imidazolonepropionase
MTPATFDLLLTDVHLATMRDASGFGVVRDGAVGITAGRIAWIGPGRDVPRDVRAAARKSCDGRWATPGLVDCHTHLVYAGNRANEFERRLHGATYADIAREGGGINATVRATRAATEDELACAKPRTPAANDRARRHHGRDQVGLRPGHGERGEAARGGAAARRSVAASDVQHDAARRACAAAEFADADAYIDYVCATRSRPPGRDSPTPSTLLRVDRLHAGADARVFAAARAHGLP